MKWIPPMRTLLRRERAFVRSARATCAARSARGGLTATWVPRRSDALRWVSGSGDPDTSGARFVVTVSRGAGSIEREVGGTEVGLTAAELAALGSGAVNIAVGEVAPGGSSRPATLILTA